MSTKIILLFTLLAYSIIVSQSFMYILALKDVQLNIGANTYVERRKLIDASMRSNFNYVIYAAILFNLGRIIGQGGSPFFNGGRWRTSLVLRACLSGLCLG